MIKSMTGFAAKEIKIRPFGKISAELRSTNHKFLDAVLHLPEGFLSLEDNIKKIIESRIKRGRITCVVNLTGKRPSEIFINKPLINKYLGELNRIKKQGQIKGDATLDTLIHLPGVLAVEEKPVSPTSIWPRLKILVTEAVADLDRARQKEGRAMYLYLKKRSQVLVERLGEVRARFKKVIAEKLETLKTDEEKSSFLKDSDISEELERLSFHIKNFSKKISGNGAIGKELDFIAQEMQRETNTAGAKTCDANISAKIVEIKSQIEQIREQAQNVE